MNKALDYGKIPPQATDLEETVLGAILLEGRAMDELQDLISERVFYKETHKVIYRALKNMYANNEQIDMLTLAQKLKSQGKLEEAGGASYISKLTSRVASAAHIKEHSAILKQKAVQREMIHNASEILKQAYDETVDIEDLIRTAGKSFDGVVDWLYSGARETEFNDLLQQAASELEERVKKAAEGGSIGIPTGIQDLNKMTGGWQNGDLVIIAGRPSMGKTAVALQYILEAARDEKPVVCFSLEMQAVRLVDRMVTGQSQLDPERYRNGKIDDTDWPAVESAISELTDLPVHIDDSPVVTMDYIKARCRQKKRKGQCDMVIIDYLGLVEMESSHNKNREREVAEVSRQAKILAKELDIPVIMLSQLNRSCESRPDKRPMLADLRESGAIEQDADMVILLHRPGKYGIEFMDIDGQEQSSKNLGELIIAKQRNGRIGTVLFKHNESLTRIFDYVPESFMPSGFEREQARPVVVDNRDLDDVAIQQQSRDYIEPKGRENNDYAPF